MSYCNKLQDLYTNRYSYNFNLWSQLSLVVVLWCDMLGDFHSWQDPLCWSGPSHTLPVAGEWKKARETLKCSLLRRNVSYINNK